MTRELVVLGTASQVPTRRRNHNGYFLRWDAQGLLFDPGEGTQRQMLFAGVPASAVTWICVTHFHGDHCLGLPGMLQRMSLERVAHPVTLAFPASGSPFVERLRAASLYEDHLDLVTAPVETPGSDGLVTLEVPDGTPFALSAARLRHGVDTIGWRIDEPAGRRMLPDRLAAAGVEGPDVGRLAREGSIAVGGRLVTLEETSATRPGQSAAFVMDTGWCDGALALARGADLLVCEATFSNADAALAARYMHLTAGQAGQLAARAGARRLVLTHFSQRYPDVGALVDQARAEYDGDVVAASDLARVPVPSRRASG